MPSPGPYFNRKLNNQHPTNPHIPPSSFHTAFLPIPSCCPMPLLQLFRDGLGTHELLCLTDICRQYPAIIPPRGTTARLPLLSQISHILLCIDLRCGSSPPTSAHASPWHPPPGVGLTTPLHLIGHQTYLRFCRADVSGALQITKWLIRKVNVIGGTQM